MRKIFISRRNLVGYMCLFNLASVVSIFMVATSLNVITVNNKVREELSSTVFADQDSLQVKPLDNTIDKFNPVVKVKVVSMENAIKNLPIAIESKSNRVQPGKQQSANDQSLKQEDGNVRSVRSVVKQPDANAQSGKQADANEKSKIQNVIKVQSGQKPVVYSAIEPDIIKILLWSELLGGDDFNVAKMSFDKCKVNQCKLLTNRTQYNESDVVVINSFSLLHGVPKPPMYKLDHQRWLFYAHEATRRTANGKYWDKWKGMFDISATYRSDADLWLPYGYCEKMTDSEIAVKAKEKRRNFTTGKKGFILWYVSNCESESLRENYVKELRKYVPVDIFGRCGNSSCPRNDHKCLNNMLAEYKFYLAFENSLCEDYITEKPFRLLFSETVPIVLGHSNYSRYLPPHSFIDIKDYPSPKALAKYLINMNNYASQYGRFFEWHWTHKCIPQHASLSSHPCELCEFLHKTKNEKKRILDMTQYWNKETDCISPKQYFAGSLDPKLL